MFREMRRKKQLLSENETKEILLRNNAGTLAVYGDNGYPYSVPISYVYFNKKIYFHCAKTGHKLDAITSNNRVSFSIIDKDEIVPEKFTTYFRSIILFGRAGIVTDKTEFDEAIFQLAKKYSSQVPEDLISDEIKHSYNNFYVVAIEIDHMTGKASIELVNG